MDAPLQGLLSPAPGEMAEMKRRQAFTLIELLVVIAIIALLMAILMPCLQRVRKQARTVGCHANLKQWSLVFLMYADENSSRFPNWVASIEPWPLVLKALWPSHQDTDDLFLCPMAKKLQSQPDSSDSHAGSTFSPWTLRGGMSSIHLDCSYGLNRWAQYVPGSGTSRDPRYWQTVPVQGAANVPLLLDSVLWWSCQSAEPKPPAQEQAWTESELSCCVNRHDGFVCGNFMDWSVRKVGLKELWSLKWHREYDTRGYWTKASGVQPDSWPTWMRKFKDY